MKITLTEEEALWVLTFGLRELGAMKSDEDVTAFELRFKVSDVSQSPKRNGLTITAEKTHGEETSD